MTFSEAVAASGNERVAAITFDDAYRSVLELGKPLLDEHGWPATVFVPTDWAGTDRPMRWPGIEQWHGGPHEPELVPMGWDELRALDAAGWEIGSHTCSHPRLTTLGDEDLARELRASREVCERELSRPVETIAYPYGDVDERVERAAGAAGYHLGAALPNRLHDERALCWPRIGIYVADDERRFALKVAPLLRRARRSRAWSALRALRSR